MGLDAEFKVGKKKRANRSAKLKQCKLDARREQWLSQVKKTECKDTITATSPTFPSELNSDGKLVGNERNRPVATATLEHNVSRFQESSDPVSATHHPSANHSRKKCPSNNSISSSGSSYGSYSRSVSDAEENNEEAMGEKEGSGIDDWEAIADALSVTMPSHNSQEDHRKSADSPEAKLRTPEVIKPEPERTTPRAWRPDDVLRPQTLPNLLKHRSFPVNMEGHYDGRRSHHRVVSPPPSSCPICYEELDLTDSSFLPCSCGFRLCLFCHKRIVEADARCPGCRKQYNPIADKGGIDIIMGVGVPPLPYRSCSMVSR